MRLPSYAEQVESFIVKQVVGVPKRLTIFKNERPG